MDALPGTTHSALFEALSGRSVSIVLVWGKQKEERFSSCERADDYANYRRAVPSTGFFVPRLRLVLMASSRYASPSSPCECESTVAFFKAALCLH